MKRLLLFFFYIVTVDMTDGNMRQLAIEKTSVSSYTVLSVFWQNKETEKRLRILCLEMRNFIQVPLR